MNIKRKVLITILSLTVCLCAAYVITDHIPASFEKIDTDDQNNDKTSISDTRKNNNPAVNLMFAVDSGYVSSDCNIGNTIIDTASKMFRSDFADKNNVSVQICIFSGSSSANTSEVISSDRFEEIDNVECFISDIKKHFGNNKGNCASSSIPVHLAQISQRINTYDSTYLYVFTDKSQDDKEINSVSENTVFRNIDNLHISYVIPSDASDQTAKYYKALSEISQGKVFDEYIKKDGANNISAKIPDDLCDYTAQSLLQKKKSSDVSENKTKTDYDYTDTVNECTKQENDSQLYEFKNGDKILFEYHNIVDSDNDGCSDSEDPFPDEQNGFYNRRKAREHAQIAYTTLKNGQFRYLSPANGDSATNCANYVSQCIYAGGYPMTENWYMKKYDSSTPKIKKFTDKLTSFTKSRLFESFDIGKSTDQYYTDMSYIWTNSWSCANVQAEYGEKNFFDESIIITDYSDVSATVLEHGVQSGDVIYQGIDDKHHVLMISDVGDDGTLFVSSHNPPKYQEKVDEAFWKKGGFSQVVIYKVKDIIK